MIQIVAVVDATPDNVTVWHVDVGTETPGMSRMCGAWVLTGEAHKVELLTRRRRIVTTPAGQEALQAAGSVPAGLVDLNHTIKSVAAERDRLQALFDALPASRRKTWVAPRWPNIPADINLDAPPKAVVPTLQSPPP